MSRSPSQPPAPLSGIGYYADSPLPVDIVRTGIRNFLGSLKGPPGLRLAQTNDPSGKYFGTNLVPGVLSVESVPPKVNRPVDLEQAPIQGDTYGPGVPL